MKNIKYAVFAFLVLITFIFVGDSFMWNKYDFYETYDSINTTIMDDVPIKDGLESLSKIMDKGNAEYFIAKGKIVNSTDMELTIYADEATQNIISKDNNIDSKLYKSFAVGSLNIKFKELDELASFDNESDYICILGENIDYDFLKQIFGDESIVTGNEENYAPYITLALWCIVFSILLLMTIYESSLMKKEIVLRMVSGEKISAFVLKNIIKDSLVFILLFGLIYAVSSRITTASFCLKYAVFMFGIFIVLNSLLLTFRGFISYKRDIGTKVSAKRALIFSYIYKSISGVLLIVSLGLSITVIRQSFDYYSQASFFEQYKDYNFVMIGTSDKNIDGKINMELYKDKDENYDCFSMVETSWSDKDIKWIEANKGAINYLREKIPELENIDLESKFYILTPKGKHSQRHINELISLIEEEYNTNDILYEIVEYTGKKRFISFSHTGKYNIKTSESPIIVLNNYPSEVYMNRFNPLYLFNPTLFDINQKELDLIIKDHKLEEGGLYLTSTTEIYNQQRSMAKRTMVIGLIMLIISLSFEFMIISSILKFEGTVNSSKIILKKTLGYSIFERYKALIVIMITTYIAGVIGAVILMSILGLDIMPVLSAIIVLGLLEFAATILNITKVENANIQKVMKGG